MLISYACLMVYYGAYVALVTFCTPNVTNVSVDHDFHNNSFYKKIAM